MRGWLRLCICTVSLAVAAGTAFAQEMTPPAGAHLDGVAAEAAAGADAIRDNGRGDETFLGTYSCVSPSATDGRHPSSVTGASALSCLNSISDSSGISTSSATVSSARSKFVMRERSSHRRSLPMPDLTPLK